MRLPAYPFEDTRRIGTVAQVTPATAIVNLPNAGERTSSLHHGELLRGGEVAEFVTIDGGDCAVFGRILRTRTPEAERLELEDRDFVGRGLHPTGDVQLLATIDLPSWTVTPGIRSYPRIGSPVHGASAAVVSWVVTMVNRRPTDDEAIRLDLGVVDATGGTRIVVTPEQLFGRHCAVLGTTGGGKSWTMARMVEQVAQYRSKMILLDPSGEYAPLKGRVTHVRVGTSKGKDTVVSVPYRSFAETDLFALFSPAAQTQAPKLREAIRSLRLAELLGTDHPLVDAEGVIKKEGMSKSAFLGACRDNKEALAELNSHFDVELLARQIELECVFPSGNYGKDPTVWGSLSERDLTYCISMIYRIETVIASDELAPVFGATGVPSVFDQIDSFLADPEKSLLRISLADIPFQFAAREMVANAIGRYLLRRAREGHFSGAPCVVCLDEAHHFLNKSIGDEFATFPLDAFELIAKEGRKYGLTLCLATQRPRDVPEGVLSQMGTLVVHRMINHDDRYIVERASGELDRSAAAFLPTLGPGEALVIGVAFPIPLPVQVAAPDDPPESLGPQYQEKWAAVP